MEAKRIYQYLEKDFITAGMSDDWAGHIDSVADYITENFKQRSMGLVCDFATEINKVFTAVFPSNEVMQKILDTGAQDMLLFVHHAAVWDIRKSPQVFQQMDRGLLQQFKDNRISIFNLHVPLDNYGEYSTGVTLARALGIKPEKPFASYFGAMAGVFGKIDCSTVQALKDKLQDVVAHGVCLYSYGDNEIKDNTVAVVAGGGLGLTIREIVENKINVLVTGISSKNEYSKEAHEFAEKYRVNILGGTHYSTEKFACIRMVNYFQKLGLPAEFLAENR
jgi:putative NIF3 family GTP cyclohydrolase 1 type 2